MAIPLWIFGVALSIIIGVTTWRAGKLSATALLSLLLTLCGIMLTLAVDQRIEILGLRGDLEEATKERQADVAKQNEALRDLLPLYEASQSDVLRPIVYGLVEAHNALTEKQNSVMTSIFGLRLEKLAAVWFPISQGHLELSGEELGNFSILAVLSAKHGIDATNYVDFESWWESDLGRRYLTANFDAVKRGVPVRRIFVFGRASQCSIVERHLEEQYLRGIKVFVALEEWIPRSSRADILLVDGVVAGKLQLDERRLSQGAEINSDRFSVEHIRDLFESTLSRARPFRQLRCGVLGVT